MSDSDIESVKMVKNEEELEDIRYKARRIAYSLVVRKVVCVRRKDKTSTRGGFGAGCKDMGTVRAT